MNTGSLLGVLAVAAAVVAVVLWFARRTSGEAPGRSGALPTRADDPSIAPGPGPFFETNTTAMDESGADPPGLPDVLIDPTVVVRKADRTLEVFSDGVVAKRYRIALGQHPVGPKQRSDDLRTPEGEYFVCAKTPAQVGPPSLGLSYPNDDDTARGLAQGLITTREGRTIREALRRMEPPPKRTRLGGDIRLCGGGTATNWTDGSIALSDEDVAELSAMLPLGTPVRIDP